MKSEGTLRPLLKLSAPIIIVHLGFQITGMVDTALAGRLGALSLAAAGLGHTLFLAGAIFGMGLVIAIDPLASQSFGAGRPDRARSVLRHGLVVGMLTALPISLLIIASRRPTRSPSAGGWTC